MSATRELTITLPEKLADLVRCKVSSGAFSTESDYITASLVESLFEPLPLSMRSAEKSDRESTNRLEALRKDPSIALSHDEFWSQLEAQGVLDEAE